MACNSISICWRLAKDIDIDAVTDFQQGDYCTRRGSILIVNCTQPRVDMHIVRLGDFRDDRTTVPSRKAAGRCITPRTKENGAKENGGRRESS